MSVHATLRTSGAYEYYTPQPIIEAARAAMGSIDLDPASSVVANARVRADTFFDEAADGLCQPWFGHVWMNHPFGRGLNERWVQKLLTEWRAERVTTACAITYACTSERWFRPLLELPQCFLTPRTNYLLPDGSVKRGVQKGSVVTYLGSDVDRFADAFGRLGVVKV